MNGVCKSAVVGVVAASMATSVIFIVLNQVGSAGNKLEETHTKCLACADVSQPSDCNTSFEILPHERCSIEVFISLQGERVYRFGSKKATDCDNSNRLPPFLTILCHGCCIESMCNRDLCVLSEEEESQPVEEIQAIRLADGVDERSGRLEVLTQYGWGTVCDDEFGNSEARVVCRSLGFTDTGLNAGDVGTTVLARSYFSKAPLEMRVLLDDVTCRGNETSLNECGHSFIGTSSCMYWDVVGIFCGPVEIEAVRLAGHENEHGGRVEVMIQGAWGSVWSPHLDTNTASVICQSLGHNTTGYPVPAKDFFTPAFAQFPILLEDLMCYDNESSLNECQHRLFTDHPMDTFRDRDKIVGVVCGERFDPFVSQIRLAESNNPREGRLDVMINGTWGSVCNNPFRNAAPVVCRMLGLSFSSAEVMGWKGIVRGTGRIHLSRVVCSGSESNLNSCRFNAGDNDCIHFEDVGVRCT